MAPESAETRIRPQQNWAPEPGHSHSVHTYSTAWGGRTRASTLSYRPSFPPVSRSVPRNNAMTAHLPLPWMLGSSDDPHASPCARTNGGGAIARRRARAARSVERLGRLPAPTAGRGAGPLGLLHPGVGQDAGDAGDSRISSAREDFRRRESTARRTILRPRASRDRVGGFRVRPEGDCSPVPSLPSA